MVRLANWGMLRQLAGVAALVSGFWFLVLVSRFSFLVGGGRGGLGVAGEPWVIGFGIRFVFEYFYFRICGGVGVPGGI